MDSVFRRGAGIERKIVLLMVVAIRDYRVLQGFNVVFPYLGRESGLGLQIHGLGLSMAGNA